LFDIDSLGLQFDARNWDLLSTPTAYFVITVHSRYL
jgi:hypothetical protein